MDKNRGGKREGAGRKSKSEELTLVKLGINAIESVYGSQEDYWKHIATKSKESMPHLKLLSEYVYGKPKETKDIKIQNVPVIDMSTWK
jgi:hypothetical protein